MKGFTLVELMVAMTIMAIVTGIGVAGYNSFNRKQQLSRAADTIATELRTVQKRADSGQIPSGSCNTGSKLDEYRIDFSSNQMTVFAVCTTLTSLPITTSINIGTVDVHPNIAIASGSVRFYTAQGGGGAAATSATITLSHTALPGDSLVIRVQPSGAIDVL